MYSKYSRPATTEKAPEPATIKPTKKASEATNTKPTKKVPEPTTAETAKKRSRTSPEGVAQPEQEEAGPSSLAPEVPRPSHTGQGDSSDASLESVGSALKAHDEEERAQTREEREEVEGHWKELSYGAHIRNGTCTVYFAKTALEEEDAVEETVGAVPIARASYESSQSAIALWSVPVASEPGALNSILSRRHKFRRHSNSNLVVHIRGIIVGFGSLLLWG
ncbi:hypothetical protein N7474_007291 [Penicillium riverlandense]|uniref:uncharacterized protein n=1 Tax=Penicillium riverlandense TaxID=1903569 RepID=UPI002547E102|nr:uncharacterized protein N7474_007291 [Penicillium riverlandense]KAJ5815514.1 hypothetical protein N7474_007291 [Penicillium riverlandense]